MRENQRTFNLFFTIRLEKPQVSRNWVDYNNANKHIYFGVIKSMEKQQVKVRMG